MSRDEALEKLARILEQHYPHPVFGCECMLATQLSQEDVDQTPVLNEQWTDHIAKIAFDAAKGF